MDKICFGIAGTNFIGDWVIAGVRQDEHFKLVTVCSRTQETADAPVSKHNIPYTFTSLEEIAKNLLTGAAYTASPNFLYASQSILCMGYDKRVPCEKPSVSSAKEVRAMIEVSRTYNVALMEVMKSTLMPNFLAIRESLGRVGTVCRYFTCYCQYSSRYDKFKEGIALNAFKPELSNGAMVGIGIYTVRPVVVLLGRLEKIDASDIVLSSGADGQGVANFLYEGMNATVLYSRIVNSVLPTETQGEEGNLTLDRINIIRKVTYSLRLASAMRKGPEPVPEDLSMVANKDKYYYEVVGFINLVLFGKRESETNSLDNSLTMLEIIDEVHRRSGIMYPAD